MSRKVVGLEVRAPLDKGEGVECSFWTVYEEIYSVVGLQGVREYHLSRCSHTF